VKKEFIVNRQGKDFVLYEGLLDEAHQQGLSRISTTLIQLPHEENGNMAVVAAEVETSKGVFSAIGEASPQADDRTTTPMYIALAEANAKSRALADAVNIGIQP
jgi:hypothetical protein